jgi:hypothetical protein
MARARHLAGQRIGVGEADVRAAARDQWQTATSGVSESMSGTSARIMRVRIISLGLLAVAGGLDGAGSGDRVHGRSHRPQVCPRRTGRRCLGCDQDEGRKMLVAGDAAPRTDQGKSEVAGERCGRDTLLESPVVVPARWKQSPRRPRPQSGREADLAGLWLVLGGDVGEGPCDADDLLCAARGHLPRRLGPRAGPGRQGVRCGRRSGLREGVSAVRRQPAEVGGRVPPLPPVPQRP